MALFYGQTFVVLWSKLTVSISSLEKNARNKMALFRVAVHEVCGRAVCDIVLKVK